MADYHPLIARAVAGLERNTGENRRVLYDRARNALVSQLRSVQPPLEENDVTRERLALEDAIRKVEAEAAQRVRQAALEKNVLTYPTQGCVDGERGDHILLAPPFVLMPEESEIITKALEAAIAKVFDSI